jgi:hypothetical protein
LNKMNRLAAAAILEIRIVVFMFVLFYIASMNYRSYPGTLQIVQPDRECASIQ